MKNPRFFFFFGTVLRRPSPTRSGKRRPSSGGPEKRAPESAA
ncbi:unnamed protein product [Ectocarpus sp. 6 AP-2014]